VNALKRNARINGGRISIITVCVGAGVATQRIIDWRKLAQVQIHITGVNGTYVAILAIHIGVAATANRVQWGCMPTDVCDAKIQIACVIVIARNVIIGLAA